MRLSQKGSSRLFCWITRTAPLASRTAAALADLGHGSLIAPVLQSHPIFGPPKMRPEAIVFTSAHGVANHPFDPSWSELPVFAVGDSTAHVAEHCGYRDVRSARGAVEDLQRLIATSLPRPARVLYFGAREPAGDLHDYLLRSGYQAEHCVVYETSDSSRMHRRVALTALPAFDAILIHSPKAARRVAEVIARHAWTGLVFCISEACAEEFGCLDRLSVQVAIQPSETSLMALIRRVSPTARQPTRSSFGELFLLSGRCRPSPANDTSSEHFVSHGRNMVETSRDDSDPPPSAA